MARSTTGHIAAQEPVVAGGQVVVTHAGGHVGGHVGVEGGLLHPAGDVVPVPGAVGPLGRGQPAVGPLGLPVAAARRRGPWPPRRGSRDRRGRRGTRGSCRRPAGPRRSTRRWRRRPGRSRRLHRVEDEALAEHRVEGPLQAADDPVARRYGPHEEAVVLADRPRARVGRGRPGTAATSRGSAGRGRRRRRRPQAGGLATGRRAPAGGRCGRGRRGRRGRGSPTTAPSTPARGTTGGR